MKLLSLKLENWRGVESREVKFADGVTLIEGPNEIGKSTIVEALQAIFTVMDSSSKTNIKAIQPVGQDVGSGVEVEVMAGDFHFIYSKTYNKNKKTELRVLAPQAEQFTGREAHERVERILDESVDMALWNALLVEQGKEVAGVTLSQSDGLARALDEAAGGESPEQGDGDLFARVQAEYEQYFNLKSGKAKRNYASLEESVDQANDAVSSARNTLSEIETDSENYESCTDEIHRLDSELPGLEQGEIDHEKIWRAVSQLQKEIASKRENLESAEALVRSEEERLAGRNQLIKQLEESTQSLQLERDKVEPLDTEIKELEKLKASKRQSLKTAKVEHRKYREISELANGDLDHLKKVARVDLLRKNLATYQEYSEDLDSDRAALRAIKITAAGLEELRETDRELHVAAGRLETATSSIEISAETTVNLALNDEKLTMSAGETEQRNIADELEIVMPGVASIRIKPPQSVKELETVKEYLKENLGNLLEKFNIKSLSEAVTQNEDRVRCEANVQSLNEKIASLLGGESLTEWEALVTELERESELYLAQRDSEPAIATSLYEAKSAAEEIKLSLDNCAETVEELEKSYAELVENYEGVNASLRTGNEVVIGLEAAKRQRETDLETARAIESDEALSTLVVTRTANLEVVQSEMADLEEKLKSDSPETAKALYENAKAAHKRANEEKADQLTAQAILEDRLKKAQANGRFEELEAAEHKLVELEESYNAMHARAMAVQNLWQILNKHRDASRKSYVRPLKEGVEQLGRIVFGADFTIELGDDWDLLSRTQDGKTIPFDDLSIGAKEQLGILMRLAAARIVSNQGGVPLIIDDALGFSDPTRLKTMGAAIASAGRDCQVILLTCTPGRFTHVGNAQVVRF